MDRESAILDFLMSMDALRRAVPMRQGKGQPMNCPTHAQIGLLCAIAQDGQQSITDLAQRFHMTSSATTQFVDALQKDGLVARIGDAKDRRKIRITLTPAGKKKLAFAKNMRIKKLLQLFKPLSDREMMQLLKLQRKITDHLTDVWRNPNQKT